MANSAASIANAVSSNLDPLTATTGDNLHPSGLGATMIARYPKGQSIVDILDRILPPFRPAALRTDLYDPAYNPTGHIFANPQLIGTGGNIGTGASPAGGVANNMTVSRSAGNVMTAVCSKIAATDDAGAVLPQDNGALTVQRITLGKTGDEATQNTIRLRCNGIAAGPPTFQAGDVVEIGMEIRQAGLGDTISSIMVVATEFDGATSVQYAGNSASGIGSDREPSDATRLIMMPRFTIRPYAGPGTANINIDLLINALVASGQTPQGTVDVLGIVSRKVQNG